MTFTMFVGFLTIVHDHLACWRACCPVVAGGHFCGFLQLKGRTWLQGQAATTGGMDTTTQGTTGMDSGYTGTGTTGSTGYTGADTTTTGTGTTGTTGHTGHHAGEHADFVWRLRPGMLDTLLCHAVIADELPSCRWPHHCGEGQGNGARNPGDSQVFKQKCSGLRTICFRCRCFTRSNKAFKPALFSHCY